MKKVTNACIGGRSFTLDEDAYGRLSAYLEHFRARLTVPELQKGEVMDEIEGRIAELFYQEVGDGARVVSLQLVEKVISTLGMPDGSAETGTAGASFSGKATESATTAKKLFRDKDEKRLGGVCSGLSWYFDLDVTLIRVLMLVALICGTAGFWVYVILWIAIPAADTPARKCEMRGIPATAENMARFARSTGSTDGYKK
jgi:phage shock protein PspC (stress-responsive transcriptional regulator)